MSDRARVADRGNRHPDGHIGITLAACVYGDSWSVPPTQTRESMFASKPRAAPYRKAVSVPAPRPFARRQSLSSWFWAAVVQGGLTPGVTTNANLLLRKWSTYRKGKRFYVVRGPGEDRSDEEIFAEANTEVVVPVFRPGS